VPGVAKPCRDEPYAFIGHVRICGSPGGAIPRGDPAGITAGFPECPLVHPVNVPWFLTQPLANPASDADRSLSGGDGSLHDVSLICGGKSRRLGPQRSLHDTIAHRNQ
jgi:hypothetical protein